MALNCPGEHPILWPQRDNFLKRAVNKKRAAITLVDRESTRVWKPLLHGVAAGTMNAFHDEQNYFVHAAKHHYDFQPGSLTVLDRQQKQISLAPISGSDGSLLVPARKISHDLLVIARPVNRPENQTTPALTGPGKFQTNALPRPYDFSQQTNITGAGPPS